MICEAKLEWPPSLPPSLRFPNFSKRQGKFCGAPLAWRLLHGWAKKWSQGLVNFVPAVAYQLCSSLPAAFTQPGASTLANLCK